jgi:hypothetical protein
MRVVAPPALICRAPEITTALIPQIHLLVIEVTILLEILNAISIPFLEILTHALLMLLI